MTTPMIAGRPDVRRFAWEDFEAEAATRIANLHILLETPSVDPVTTENLRGQIVAWRDFLALGAPDTSATLEAPDYSNRRSY